MFSHCKDNQDEDDVKLKSPFQRENTDFSGDWILAQLDGDVEVMYTALDMTPLERLFFQTTLGSLVGIYRLHIDQRDDVFNFVISVKGTDMREKVRYKAGEVMHGEEKELLCAYWLDDEHTELQINVRKHGRKMPSMRRFLRGGDMMTELIDPIKGSKLIQTFHKDDGSVVFKGNYSEIPYVAIDELLGPAEQ